MHIAIAGNIGSGKTTLTGLLSKYYRCEAQYEDVENNPYLERFYEDMQRWSFNLQIYFLNNRIIKVIDIRNSGKFVIQDRTIYEDSNIFAANLHSMGLLSTIDYNNYLSSFELISSFIQPPDLLLYLKASIPTLVKHIQKRGREYENAIRLDYLNNLNDRYEEWVSNYNLGKILIIDIDKVNFTDNPEGLGIVINKIDSQIHGLF